MADLRGLLYREFRLYVTNRLSIILSLLSPLLYFGLFGMSMAQSGLISTEDYLLYLLPGYVTLSLFTTVNTIGQGMFNERLGGMLTELLTCPVRIAAYILAKIIFAAAVASIQALILLGSVIWTLDNGIRILTAPDVLTLLPILILSGLLLASLISIIVGAAETVQLFITLFNLLNPILLFASSIFYPIERLPSWFRIPAQINPLTWVSKSVQGVLGEGPIDLVQTSFLVVATLVGLSIALVLNRWRIRRL